MRRYNRIVRLSWRQKDIEMANYKAGKMANEMTLNKIGTSMASHGTFHSRRGLDVELSEENTVALIGGVHKFDPVCNGSPATIDMRRIVFSSKPIEVTGRFQVNVTRRRFVSKWGHSFMFDAKHNYGAYHNPYQTMVSISSHAESH